jgi:hypothetical protein
MFKVCQYAIDDDKILVGVTLMNVKDAQARLQKTITWPKKLGKGRLEWERACMDNGM